MRSTEATVPAATVNQLLFGLVTGITILCAVIASIVVARRFLPCGPRTANGATASNRFRQSASAVLGASVTYQYVKQEDMAYLKQSIDEAVELSQT